GISVVHEEDVRTKIWPLAVRKIKGIGPKAEIKLHKLQLMTIGDIAAQSQAWLVDNFGKSYGAWMHEAAWGRDERPVVTESEPVSMSRETTFDRDLHAVRDKAELGAIFTDLCVRVAEDLRRKGYVGKTIGIKLRYDDFKIATRDQTLERFTDDPALIRRTAGLCLKRVDLSRKLRLLGVRVGKLARMGSQEAVQASVAGVRVAEPEAGAYAGTMELF
ncbi:MAG TPA: DNA polymerase IV, partial [Ramlibacter sp.]|nr:DNA polymerase IV [Ramlibacter sp.]